jgi:hypothetical protein
MAKENHPYVLALRQGTDALVLCPWCRKVHVHGNVADGTHRVAHCLASDGPYAQAGYIVKIIGDVVSPEAGSKCTLLVKTTTHRLLSGLSLLPGKQA